MPARRLEDKTRRGPRGPRRSGRAAALLAGVLLAGVGPAGAQSPAPDPYAQPVQVPPEPAAPTLPSIRQLFASTLAAVATAGSSALTVGLTQAIAGGLTTWFNRKLKVDPAAGGPYAQPASPEPYPSPPSYPPSPPYPSAQPDAGAEAGYSAYGPPPSPSAPTADPGAAASDAQAVYPQPQYAQPPPAPVQYYDTYTGAATAPDASLAAAPVETGDAGLYAGFAFEVHAVHAGGGSFAVDPASHVFRTGERFVVYYRPTLPGRIDVYNINPAGRQSLIDSVQIAAGELAQLGPYEFAAMTGDEQLKLVLQPCTTAALTSATRDIVKVSQPEAAPALVLAPCGPVTRSARPPRTRDIRKVALDGTTGFALDPLSPQEQASGLLDAREVTIVFRHR